MRPPPLRVVEGPWDQVAYDPTQRAYVLRAGSASGSGGPAELCLRLEGSEESPVWRPALVVEGWGEEAVDVLPTGGTPNRPRPFRVGHERNLQRTDLVVWLDVEADGPLEIQLHPRRRRSKGFF